MIRPLLQVADIRALAQISVKNFLIASGIRHLIFDKDNTITLPHSLVIHSPLKDAWRDLVSSFSVSILSNDITTETVEIDGIPCLNHRLSKPFCLLATRKIPFKREEIAMIGDRILTDMLFAKWMGYKGILLNPLLSTGYSRIERFFVSVERRLLC